MNLCKIGVIATLELQDGYNEEGIYFYDSDNCGRQKVCLQHFAAGSVSFLLFAHGHCHLPH